MCIRDRYISIERLISDTKENYYEALQESSWEWHEARNDYAPCVKYSLGVIVAAYREFADRVEILTVPHQQGHRPSGGVQGPEGAVPVPPLFSFCAIFTVFSPTKGTLYNIFFMVVFVCV